MCPPARWVTAFRLCGPGARGLLGAAERVRSGRVKGWLLRRHGPCLTEWETAAGCTGPELLPLPSDLEAV